MRRPVSRGGMPLLAALVGASVLCAISTSASAASTPNVSWADNETVPLTGPALDWINAAGDRQYSVAVYDHKTGVTYINTAANHYNTASIVKVMILEKVLYHAQVQHRTLTSFEREHAAPMIENSSNADATALFWHVGGGPALQYFAVHHLHLRSTYFRNDGYWGLTRTTAADQIRVVSFIAYPNWLFTTGSRDYAIGLLNKVEDDQRWGMPVDVGTHTWNKNGWIPQSPETGDASPGWTMNSIGHVTNATLGIDYTVAILSRNEPDYPTGQKYMNTLGQLLYQQQLSEAAA